MGEQVKGEQFESRSGHLIVASSEERISSDDYLSLMHLAVNTDDITWFNELSGSYENLKSIEDDAREELGFTS